MQEERHAYLIRTHVPLCLDVKRSCSLTQRQAPAQLEACITMSRSKQWLNTVNSRRREAFQNISCKIRAVTKCKYQHAHMQMGRRCSGFIATPHHAHLQTSHLHWGKHETHATVNGRTTKSKKPTCMRQGVREALAGLRLKHAKGA